MSWQFDYYDWRGLNQPSSRGSNDDYFDQDECGPDWDSHDCYRPVKPNLNFNAKEFCRAAVLRLRDETKVWTDKSDIELNEKLEDYLEVLKQRGLHDKINTLIEPIAEDHGHLEIIFRLVANGADIDSLINGNHWPTDGLAWLCHLSAIWRRPSEVTELAMRLLDLGAEIDKAAYDGKHCLLNAYGHDLIELLLDKGVNVDIQDPINGNTKLHDLAKCDDIKTMKLLIDRGADSKKNNFKDEDPLQFALMGGARETTRYLLELLSDCNPAGRLYDAYKLLGCIEMASRMQDHNYIDWSQYEGQMYQSVGDFIYDGHENTNLLYNYTSFRGAIDYWKKASTYLENPKKDEIFRFKSKLCENGSSFYNKFVEPFKLGKVHESNQFDRNYDDLLATPDCCQELTIEALLIMERLVDITKHDAIFKMIYLFSSTLEGRQEVEFYILCLKSLIIPNKIRTRKSYEFMKRIIDQMFALHGYDAIDAHKEWITMIYTVLSENMVMKNNHDWYKPHDHYMGTIVDFLLIIIKNEDILEGMGEKFIQDAAYVNPVDTGGKSLLHNIITLNDWELYDPSSDMVISRTRLFLRLVESGIKLSSEYIDDRIDICLIKQHLTDRTFGDEFILKTLMQALLHRGLHLHSHSENQMDFLNYMINQFELNEIFVETKLICLAAMAIDRHDIKYQSLDLPEDYVDLIEMHSYKSKPKREKCTKSVNFDQPTTYLSDDASIRNLLS